MKHFICLLVISLLLTACAAQKSSVSFRPAQDFTNFQNVFGLRVGAEIFEDSKQAEEAFGFNIRAAGLLPVQVVLDNKSGQGIDVIAGQTFLIDENNRYWKVLSVKEAIERVQKSPAVKGPAQGALPGLLQRLSFAVVSGSTAGMSIITGDASAVDAAGGTGKAEGDRQGEMKNSEEYRDKDLEGKVMFAETLASGIVYFPGEASSIRELRLQVKFRNDRRFKTINLKLK